MFDELPYNRDLVCLKCPCGMENEPVCEELWIVLESIIQQYSVKREGELGGEGEGKMLRRGGRGEEEEEAAARPCVPGVRSDGIKAASLSLSHFPPPFVFPPPPVLPHHFFCLITHSLSV